MEAVTAANLKAYLRRLGERYPHRRLSARRWAYWL